MSDEHTVDLDQLRRQKRLRGGDGWPDAFRRDPATGQLIVHVEGGACPGWGGESCGLVFDQLELDPDQLTPGQRAACERQLGGFRVPTRCGEHELMALRGERPLSPAPPPPPDDDSLDWAYGG